MDYCIRDLLPPTSRHMPKETITPKPWCFPGLHTQGKYDGWESNLSAEDSCVVNQGAIRLTIAQSEQFIYVLQFMYVLLYHNQKYNLYHAYAR